MHFRSFSDEAKAKMGVVECAKHMVVEPFPVLYEKDGEVVAQIKSTVLMMPNGPMKITGVPVDLALFETENKIENEEIKVSQVLHAAVANISFLIYVIELAIHVKRVMMVGQLRVPIHDVTIR